MHQAQAHDENCFVTLTYSPENLPADNGLNHRHFQLFLKRLRKNTKKKISYYMCGEYGEQTKRPHYHACLFNVDFQSDRVAAGKSSSGFKYYESAQLTELWQLGRATVQDLTRETAGYCTRYIMTKPLGRDAKRAYEYTDPDTGEIRHRRPEYNRMSLRPAIGREWFTKNHRDVFPHDFAIHSGTKYAVPKYYDQLAEKLGLVELDLVKDQRTQEAKEHHEDNTRDRLAVREKVHLAKVATLKRSNL